ncbi:MAG: hypothetical protein WC516_09940 [Patescibacteria group bacterium]
MNHAEIIMKWNELNDILKRNELYITTRYETKGPFVIEFEWQFWIKSYSSLYAKDVVLYKSNSIEKVEAWLLGYEQKKTEYTIGGLS